MVFERLGIAVGNLREPHPHAGPLVQPPASCRPGGELRPQTDLHTQFFPEFPVQRGLAFLTGVHFPPGNSQSPANCSGAVRLATSMRAGFANESTIAPPTTCISPLTAPVYEGEWFAGLPPASPLKSRHMSSVVQTSTASKPKSPHVGAAIFALAMGGVGIGVTEFTMMGLLKEVEQGLGISTPEAGHLISAYALGVVVGAPLLAAVGAKLPRKYLALGLMLFFTLANLTSYVVPDYGSMLVSRFAAGLPHGAFFGVAAVIAASLVSPRVGVGPSPW
ncbi:inner membrane transport protein YdhP [Arthrobacter sp. Hiyo4]|nr:inner membrane transport protein YdhP [Arthrobacter sp. Hiyo4]